MFEHAARLRRELAGRGRWGMSASRALVRRSLLRRERGWRRSRHDWRRSWRQRNCTGSGLHRVRGWCARSGLCVVDRCPGGRRHGVRGSCDGGRADHDWCHGSGRGTSQIWRRDGVLPSAIDFGNGDRVAQGAAAEDFGADIVEDVWVVLDGSRALGGGGAWMGKALTQLGHLRSAADEHRCHEGN